MAIGKILNPQQMPQIGQVKIGDQPGKVSGSAKDGGFSDLITSNVKTVSNAVKQYEQISGQFAKGETVNVHELIIRGEQADVSLRLMSAVKNKVIEAYQEVMRMAV